MSATRAVGIHVGDDVETALGEQRARVRIGGVGELFERALHPPFGHRFARMLARIKPDLRVAAAHFEAVDRLAFEAGAEAAMSHALAFGGPGDEVVVALHRVGREIRSEEHTSELQSLMRISYAVFCLKKK